MYSYFIALFTRALTSILSLNHYFLRDRCLNRTLLHLKFHLCHCQNHFPYLPPLAQIAATSSAVKVTHGRLLEDAILKTNSRTENVWQKKAGIKKHVNAKQPKA